MPRTVLQAGGIPPTSARGPSPPLKAAENASRGCSRRGRRRTDAACRRLLGARRGNDFWPDFRGRRGTGGIPQLRFRAESRLPVPSPDDGHNRRQLASSGSPSFKIAVFQTNRRVKCNRKSRGGHTGRRSGSSLPTPDVLTYVALQVCRSVGDVRRDCPRQSPSMSGNFVVER